MSEQKEKKKDLYGPGIGNYEDLKDELPTDYEPILNRKETQEAIFEAKDYIEDKLSEELNLTKTRCPLIMDMESGMNDLLDRDGSRTPIQFHISNDNGKHPIDAQIAQAATKWKRFALKQFDIGVGEGLLADGRNVRKDYFLDHDHSVFVDQWDWEKVITEEQRNLDYWEETVRKIWKVIYGAGERLKEQFPQLDTDKYPDYPEEIEFFHAEEILDRYPDLPRKERETEMLKEHPALGIIGIGHPLQDGYPHEMRAADYDDWVTKTKTENGRDYHGLNGDILVWNPITKRRHELMSGGIRVNATTLKKQLEMADQEDLLEQPYHQGIVNQELPLTVGSGVGQSRTYMYLLRTAHLGEVSVTVWPEILKEISAERNIHVLE